MESIMTDSYVCVDLETTGLDPKRDKIIEIGAVKVEHGEVTGHFSEVVNPMRKLDTRITELTGIDDDILEDARTVGEVLPDFLEFAGEAPILGHSVLFDFSFLKRAAVNQDLVYERCGIDTLKIARKYLPELESRSLAYLCGHFGIPHHAHRAYEDAGATVRLYEKLGELFYEKETEGNVLTPGKNLFLPAPLLYQVKKEKPITIPQKEQLYKLMDRHKIIPEYRIESLSRSEASREIERILAEYGRSFS